jgi:hypothetical protein
MNQVTACAEVNSTSMKESKMRLATILALALCVAVPTAIPAVASEGVTGMHEHRVHMHHVVRGSFKAATALAPLRRLRRGGYT